MHTSADSHGISDLQPPGSDPSIETLDKPITVGADDVASTGTSSGAVIALRYPSDQEAFDLEESLRTEATTTPTRPQWSVLGFHIHPWQRHVSPAVSHTQCRDHMGKQALR